MQVVSNFIVYCAIFGIGLVIGVQVRDSYTPKPQEWIEGTIIKKDYDFSDYPFDGTDRWIIVEDIRTQRKKVYITEESDVNCDEGDIVKVEINSGDLTLLQRKQK